MGCSKELARDDAIHSVVGETEAVDLCAGFNGFLRHGFGVGCGA